MNFAHLISDGTGAVHLFCSVLAMLFGTYILFGTKGTLRHKRIGYAYSISMIIVLATAYGMYNLYGTWGIFHWLALVSTATIIGGIVPMLLRKPANYMGYHIAFMYWSVVGLYGAFVAETLVRFPKVIENSGVPNETFYMMTGVGIFVVMLIGNIVFYRKKDGWMKRYGNPADQHGTVSANSTGKE